MAVETRGSQRLTTSWAAPLSLQHKQGAQTAFALYMSQGAATPGFGDSSSSVAFLFPGQGSQALGMIGAATAALPAVAHMLQRAQEVLGYDLLELVTSGESSHDG
jgi:acyl transferase domain-containing protein